MPTRIHTLVHTFSAALIGACALASVASADGALTVKAIGTAPAPSADSAVTTLVAPAGPTSLVGQAVQTHTAVLLWRDHSSNETSFVIEARRSTDATFSAIGSVGANVTSVTIEGLSPLTDYFFRVHAANASGPSASSNTAEVITPAVNDCVSSDTVMCLNNSEFRVQALFLTVDVQTGADGFSGEAHAVKLVSDSGYLWFFNSSNIEAVVKVLNGCGVNSRFWVFAGGLTNVRVVLTVTDTVAGEAQSYDNPLNRAFQPIQDTEAFATCN